MDSSIHSSHLVTTPGSVDSHLPQPFFAQFLHISPIAMSVATLDDERYLEVNDSFLHNTGYSRDEVIGRTSDELGLWATVDDRARVAALLAERRSGQEVEVVLRTKSGGLRYVSACLQLADLNGESCVISLFPDITKHKQAEQALRDSEQR